MWQESLKSKKRTIRSFTEECTATAPLHRLNNFWFIVTKKDIGTGKASRFLIAYEAETGHYFSLGKDEEELSQSVDKKIFLLTPERMRQVIEDYKKSTGVRLVEAMQASLF